MTEQTLIVTRSTNRSNSASAAQRASPSVGGVIIVPSFTILQRHFACFIILGVVRQRRVRHHLRRFRPSPPASLPPHQASVFSGGVGIASVVFGHHRSLRRRRVGLIRRRRLLHSRLRHRQPPIITPTMAASPPTHHLNRQHRAIVSARRQFADI